MCQCAHGLKLSGLLCTYIVLFLKHSEVLEHFNQPWLILHDATFPTRFPKLKHRDNAGKIALNEVLNERYTVTSFFAVNAKKALRDHRWNRRFRTLESFWNATSVPILKAKKGIWDRTFLVPLIFCKRRSTRKKAAQKEMFPWRDSIGNIATKRSETL